MPDTSYASIAPPMDISAVIPSRLSTSTLSPCARTACLLRRFSLEQIGRALAPHDGAELLFRSTLSFRRGGVAIAGVASASS
jgi:hypothetical protein